MAEGVVIKPQHVIWNGNIGTMIFECHEPSILAEMAQSDIEVCVYHPKRSLDANRYAWHLIGLIAEKLKVSDIEVYTKCIRENGIYRDEWLPTKSSEFVIRAWSQLGKGWITDRLDFKDGQELVRFFYGTSRYNSKQMSRFIDGLVQECDQLEIPINQEEIDALVKRI